MTYQTHCVKTNGKQQLMVAETSDSTQFRITRIRKANGKDKGEFAEEEKESDREESRNDTEEDGLPHDEFPVEVGQWVVVTHDGIEFPGEVVTCVEVNVMHRSGNAWKWPNQIYYPYDNILRQLDPPTVAGSRGQFTSLEPSYIYIYTGVTLLYCLLSSYKL